MLRVQRPPRFERVAALDPREVVAEGEGVLPQRAVDVPSGIGDVGRPVRARRELERGNPSAIGPRLGAFSSPSWAATSAAWNVLCRFELS